jgi:hypothetical protein
MRNSSRWFSRSFLVALCVVALVPVMAQADPAISGLSNDHVPVNSFLRIYGSGFGEAQGSSYVTIGGRFIPALAWTDGVVNVLVNPLAYNQGPVTLDTAYPVQIVIPSTGKSSNTVNLTITSAPPPVISPSTVDQPTLSDQPVVTGFQATSFSAGDDIAIYGSGFGDAQGSGYVSVTVPFLDSLGIPFTQEVVIPVLGWSENAINAILSLPGGAQPGTYTLTVHRGNGKSASSSFPVVAEDTEDVAD